MHPRCSQIIEQASRLAADLQRRYAELVRHDLDVVPGDLSPPARLQGFQEGFLRGEPARIRLCPGRSTAFAIVAFALRKDAFGESRSSGYRFSYAINFNNVDADGYDH